MYFLTPRLVSRPSPTQARWLAGAMPLPDARWGWLSSHLVFIGVFVALRLSRTGPILSVMVAILMVTACATSLAPQFYRSLCAYSALRLRASIPDGEAAVSSKHRRAAVGFFVAVLGLGCVIAGYNLLSLSILIHSSRYPLEWFLPQWPYVVTRLIAGGWIALILGERWLLWSLRS